MNKAAERYEKIKIGLVNSISLDQARDKVKEYAANVSTGIDVQAEKKSTERKNLKQRQYTLEKFLSEVYEDWAKANLKGRVCKRIRYVFADYLHRPISDLTLDAIEQLRIDRINKGNKNSTINVDVVVLKSAINKGVKWGHIAVHPFEK